MYCLFVTAKDQTIRIWNYKTMKIELIKQYQVDISVIALHPSGMFVAIGFTDQLRFLQIQLTDLQVNKD
jgi:cilia- and flagella-associated protein 57